MEKAVLFFALLIFGVYSQDCQLIVPVNPLSATGLATPFTLMLPCNQSNPGMASFVQGVVFDQTASRLFVYNPLVITQGTTPAVTPTAPNIPQGAVVGLWFGTNAGTLTLVDQGGSLAQGNCINGDGATIFGQFAYCNALLFFATVSSAINGGAVVIPPLITAADGQICPTIRDFAIVDMDSSDNVITDYLIVGAQAAQNTAANKLTLKNAVVQGNPGDNRLVGVALAAALGCPPWKVPDLADAANTVGLAAQPLMELQAAKWQAAPQALVTLNHAMTRVNNQPSLTKVNAYRQGVGQPPAATLKDADSFAFCYNYYYTAPARMAKNQILFFNTVSPDPNAAANMFGFLAQRFFQAFGPDGLDCTNLLNVPQPVVPIKNANALVVGATITVPVAPTTPATGLAQTSLILIVVFSIVGGLLIIGLIVGVIWYRNRSMYS
jgi:hypothetical protein